ncbi:MAG TPA: hypothetical protein ENO23_08930 [Alphaproteobacteria bacterium]|nr:hypothetical protein [Alphaproteobacteria bacterium]
MTGCTDAAVEASGPSLDELRAATARYRDVEAAIADGYVRDPMNVCETADKLGLPAELGGMGVHYFRPDLLGVSGPPSPRVNGTGTHVDFRRPGVLIYEPQADGSLRLAAVENLAFRAAWEAEGHAEPPSYQGVAFNLMADDPATPIDEAHMFEPHYDLHVWVHMENPNGTYAQFNPNLTCEHHVRDAAGPAGPAEAA